MSRKLSGDQKVLSASARSWKKWARAQLLRLSASKPTKRSLVILDGYGRKSEEGRLWGGAHTLDRWRTAQAAAPMSLKTGYQGVDASITILLIIDCASPRNMPSLKILKKNSGLTKIIRFWDKTARFNWLATSISWKIIPFCSITTRPNYNKPRCFERPCALFLDT